MTDIDCPKCGQYAEEHRQRDGEYIGVCHDCRIRFALEEFDDYADDPYEDSRHGYEDEDEGRGSRRSDDRHRSSDNKRSRRKRRTMPERRETRGGGFSLEELPIEITLQFLIGAGVGAALHVFSYALYRNGSAGILVYGMMLVGSMFFLWGCAALAERKGYNMVFGMFFGFFLGLIGLGILFFLPDISRG